MTIRIGSYVEELKQNLRLEGIMLISGSSGHRPIVEFNQEKTLFVYTEECGSFLINLKKRKIEHYAYPDEKLDEEKLKKALKLIKEMAKKILLVTTF